MSWGKGEGSLLHLVSTYKLSIVPEGHTWGKAENRKFSLSGKIMKLLRLGMKKEHFMNKTENWAYSHKWFFSFQSQSLTSEIWQLTAGTHPASCLGHLTYLTACRPLPLQTDFNHLNLLYSWCLLAYSVFVE